MSSTTNFDDLFLQTLMGRLQLRPRTTTSSILSQSLEDLLLDAGQSSDSDSDSAEGKTQLATEESKLEKEIVRIIHSGNTNALKPNSGHAVSINDHHICVGFQHEDGSGYRVWEWHGHILLFDDDNGYAPEYIYGNYFEKLQGKPRACVVAKQEKKEVEDADEGEGEGEGEDEDEEEINEKVGSSGLRELIDGGVNDSVGGRILRRSITATSTRFNP